MVPITRSAKRIAAATVGAAAAASVFFVPELLEMILLDLPTKDLLLICRVSSHSKAVIENSLKIQRALLMHPEPITHVFRLQNSIQNINIVPMSDHTRMWCHGPGGADFVAVRINALVATPVNRGESLLERVSDGGLEGVKLLPLPLCTSNRTASWQRMYLTQPPERKLDINLGLMKEDGMSRIKGTVIRNHGGITMDEIIGRACHTMKGEQYHAFEADGKLSLLLTSTRVVSGESEMRMLHDKASGQPNKPRTKQDQWPGEDYAYKWDW